MRGCRLSTRRCFPRTRGDGPDESLETLREIAFPPHTRGWTWVDLIPSVRGTVSPAHAGMDLQRGAGHEARRRFPRTRGDGPLSRLGKGHEFRFPPHTRGWTFRPVEKLSDLDVSPAHAGMDRRISTHGLTRLCFPRTRGDGPVEDWVNELIVPFPPHTRGWTRSTLRRRRTIPVSPAHAGMDLRPTS